MYQAMIIKVKGEPGIVTGSVSTYPVFYAWSSLRAPQKGHAIISTKF